MGLFAFYGHRQDAGEIASYIDLNLPVDGGQNDILDEGTDNVGCLYALLFAIVLQRLIKLLNTKTILKGHRRVQQGRRLVSRCQKRVQLRFSHLELITFILHCLNRNGFLQIEIHQTLFFATNLFNLRPSQIDMSAAFRP
ncbi:hypothetical protein [Ensifer soli]|uniref:hypothetical protein n=1 Tax=Ciceribacter sp. sgz301302 TaxID=3342379 RepID=UPI0035B6C312